MGNGGAPRRWIGSWRWSEWSDLALAAAVLLISVSIVRTMPSWSPGPGAWALVLGHTVPVAFRRRAPGAAFAVSVAAGGLYVLSGWPMVGLGLASLVMTYSVAAYARRRDALVALAAGEATLVLTTLVGAAQTQPDTLAGNVLVVAGAWILGDAARRRREEALAEQQRLASDAIAHERLRIARELHDIVAHSMSVIAVQAGAGRVVIDDDVEHARRALASIEATSKRALEEMRRLLGALRSDDGPAAVSPIPTLADLDRLIAHAVEGGTPVDLVVEGEKRPAPAGIELAAYRVLQEGLTNVRRHAPGSRAEVRVRFEDGAIVLHVRNRLGPAPAAGPPGHGLIGMRERVAVYGGTLEAGPRPDGTFGLTARIPYGAQHR